MRKGSAAGFALRHYGGVSVALSRKKRTAELLTWPVSTTSTISDPSLASVTARVVTLAGRQLSEIAGDFQCEGCLRHSASAGSAARGISPRPHL